MDRSECLGVAAWNRNVNSTEFMVENICGLLYRPCRSERFCIVVLFSAVHMHEGGSAIGRSYYFS
jgi:hypothetical protein